jgi:hypothetical protein
MMLTLTPTTIFMAIMIFIFLAGTAYFYYYYIRSDKANINRYNISLLTDETVFDEPYVNTINIQPFISTRDTLYVPKLGYGLSFVWEMYIPSQGGNNIWQHNFNSLKPIISMMDSPVISYHPKKNYLSIVLKYRNNTFYAQFYELKIKNIKLQRWSKYILVIDNRTIKVYIDGVLMSTKILPSVAVIYDIKSKIVLGQSNNNFLGKVKNLSLYPYPLTYDEISLV